MPGKISKKISAPLVTEHISYLDWIIMVLIDHKNGGEFRKYIEAFENDTTGADGFMAVTSFIDDEKPLYIDTDNDLNITAFKDAAWDGVKFISGGIYGLTPPALRVLENCMENGVSRMRNYQRALVDAELKLKAFPFEKIVDVDHAGDIETAAAFAALRP